MNKFSFHNLDRSEALENFINEKTSHLHMDSNFKWFFSKEGHHGFYKVKCVFPGHSVEETGRDLHGLVSHVVSRIKAKEEKFLKAG